MPVAFGAGVVAGWLYWRAAGRMILFANRPAGAAEADQARLLRRKFAWLSAVLGVAALGALVYPLRFVPREKLADIATGLGAAFLVLALIGFVIWRVKGFLDADTRRNEADEADEAE